MKLQELDLVESKDSEVDIGSPSEYKEWIEDANGWRELVISIGDHISDVERDEAFKKVDELDPRGKMISFVDESGFILSVYIQERAIPLLKKRLPELMDRMLNKWPGPSKEW